MIHAILLALTISWDCVTQDIIGNPEEISQYCVYWGKASRTYDNYVCAAFSGCYWTLASQNFTPDVTYYFAVTATDLAGNESDFSTEATYMRVQLAPVGGRYQPEPVPTPVIKPKGGKHAKYHG